MSSWKKDGAAAARKTFQWVISIVAWAAAREHAAAQTISGNVVAGNLTVTGTVDVQGNSLQLGTGAGLSGAPLSLNYVDGQPTSVADQMQFVATRTQASWLWLYTVSGGAIQPQMWLDSTNKLTLYNRAATPVAGIQLDPAGLSTFANSIVANGTDNELPNQTLVNAHSILTEGLADARYLKNGSGGFVLGSASAYGLTLPTVALPGGTATGVNSFANMGATASGFYANAPGLFAHATGNSSTASGYYSRATNFATVASGMFSTASGYQSTASGYASRALANSATALGYRSVASGDGSLAEGYQSEASGNYATAAGPWTTASGYGQFVIGRDNVQQGSATSWVSTDPLFIIGNGTSWAPSNAFVVTKQGDTTINGNLLVNGTDNRLPNQTLPDAASILTRGLADGRYLKNGSGGLVMGTVSYEDVPYPTVALPQGAAGGAGSFAGIGSTANGYFSVALGDALAQGDRATAIGYGALADNEGALAMGPSATAEGLYSIASGYYAQAMQYYSNANAAWAQATGRAATASGYTSLASGEDSVSSGAFSTASGYGAVSLGYLTVASGDYATAAGKSVFASGYNQFVIGRYNVQQGNPTTWVATDPLFIIGNGTGLGNRSNAFVVTKQGDVTAAGTIKASKLDVDRIEPKGDLSMGDFTAGL